jgi:(R,R)-butanediol dehydrogenase / meso-butanediol dehydrogenase / diacetyl reductase
MRAAVFQEIGKPLAIQTVPDPVPAAGQVVIEVAYAGICGSDLHWTETPGLLKPGTILGHEFCGTIAESNGTNYRAGERVTALPIHPCWHCPECEGGHVFHCPSQGNIGLNRPGAFARALPVDARLIQILPAGVSFHDGALVEPLAVGYRTVGHARQLKGASVLVMGAGPIGLAVTLFAIRLGAGKVVVSEPSAGRQQMALAIGATAVIDPRTDDVLARFIAICEMPPDIVVECVGVPGVIAEAVRLVRHRGQIISAGGCYATDSFLPIDALTKELAINFSCAYEVTDFEAVIDTLAHEGIDPEPLITDMITLDELPASFEALRRPQGQCKVLVQVL